MPSPPDDFATTTVRAIRSESERAALGAFLRRRPVDAAHLFPRAFGDIAAFCSWYGAYQGGDLQAALVLERTLRVSKLFALGRQAAVEETVDFISRHLPDLVMVQVVSERLGVVSRFAGGEVRWQERLTLSPAKFTPSHGVARVEQLTHMDTAQLVALLQHRPEHDFDPSLFDRGYYHGVKVAGRLVSAAGVQFIDPANGVGVVGAVVTHPNCRERGYGAQCLSHVVGQILSCVPRALIDIPLEGGSAWRLARRVGFRPSGTNLLSGLVFDAGFRLVPELRLRVAASLSVEMALIGVAPASPPKSDRVVSHALACNLPQFAS